MDTEIKCEDQHNGEGYTIFQGDSCEVMKGIPDNSIHFSASSPPFIGLYKFSNSDRDLSNSDHEDFWIHYDFIIRETLRIMKPGRICAVHCMQLPLTKGRNGHIGMRDFRGEIIKAHQDAGWIFHSEICVWKDPVVAQQRTKSIRLLHKQIKKDSTMSGQGLADYIVVFRKPGENEEAVAGMFDQWIGADPQPDDEKQGWSDARTKHGIDISREAYEIHSAATRADGRQPWPFEDWVSILVWQRYASPVWMDINQTRTLQYRGGRDTADEVHVSPLQLDVIERCIDLWTNHGDVVFTPFMGIGSEVYAAVEMGRRGIGIELKPSYYKQALKNLSKIGTGQQAIDCDLDA